ncbi:hypothetical protein GGR53DRAFT_462066 [Hypoxylon sp. FL1150]|nr:hypothetical protein GGR53DRAFT_462066 [Hypoxylon sp. FL1150]
MESTNKVDDDSLQDKSSANNPKGDQPASLFTALLQEDVLQADHSLGPGGIEAINGSDPRPIITQGMGGEPWRNYWPPVAKFPGEEAEKPWLGWKPAPTSPGEKPWLVWMNDPKYVKAPNKAY